MNIKIKRIFCLIVLKIVIFKIFTYTYSRFKEKRFTANDSNIIVISPEFCTQSADKLLIIGLVTIAPDDFDERNIIRNKHADGLLFGADFKLLFSLGLSNDPQVNRMVVEESLKNKDILQGNFVDAAYNATKKVMLSVKWIDENCRDRAHVLRLKDNAFVRTSDNLFNLKNESNQNLVHK